MKAWGDEMGFFWEKPIVVGSTASKDGRTVVRAKVDTFRQAPPPTNYKLPTEFPQISRHKRIVIDIETYDPHLKEKGPGIFRKDGYIVGIGVRTDEWQGEYYPIRHEGGPNCDPAKVLAWLRAELAEYRGTIIGANLLYDAEWLASKGVTWPHATVDDPQWAGPLLNENQHSYKLNALAKRYLNDEKVTHELIELYGPDYIFNMHKVHPGHAKTYVMGDLDLPLRLMDTMKPLLETENLWDLYKLETRNFHFLLYLYNQGVRVDFQAAEQLGQRLKKEHDEYMARIKNLVGFEVQVWAQDSLSRAFDQQGIKYPRTPKREGKNGKKVGGAPSFKKEWLAAHPSDLAEWVLNIRQMEKYDGTFVQKFMEEAVDGRIHCLFHPLKNDDYGTVSGRFSSSNPNLQQVPARDSVFGPLIRALFIPEDGMRWWSYDYSQIEYRYLVHYAVLAKCVGAEVAAAMYRQDRKADFHKIAAELTGKPRKTAKNINFGIVYGMGKGHMAEVMGCTVAEAAAILEEYHSKMPFAREIYNMASNRALRAGFVRTILNRKRRFDFWEPQWYDKNADERPEALPREAALEAYGPRIKRAFSHKALNSVLQGSSADETKKAMVDVWEAGLIGPNAPLQAHLTVHDELDGSCDDSRAEVKEALEEVRHLMETAIPLQIPVLAEGSVGANWAEAH